MFEIQVDDHIAMRLTDAYKLSEFHDLIQANREHIGANLAWVNNVHSLEDSQTNVIAVRKAFAEGKKYGIRILYDRKVIGAIALNITNAHTGKAEIGYWLAESYTGKGIITQCVRVILDYGFGTLGLHRIGIRAAASNPKSWAIPERLNFHYEGTAKQDISINGEFLDMKEYAMLADDWEIERSNLEFAYHLPQGYIMRPVEMRDAQAIFDVVNRNRKHLSPWFEWVKTTQTMQDTKNFVQGALDQYGKNEGVSTGIWDGDRFIGSAGYVFWDHKHKKAEIGYWLDETYTGQGIMTSVARQLSKYVFDVLEFNRVIIQCLDTNIASATVAIKLGYTEEIRQRHDVLLYGERRDMRKFALLRQDRHKLDE